MIVVVSICSSLSTVILWSHTTAFSFVTSSCSFITAAGDLWIMSEDGKVTKKFFHLSTLNEITVHQSINPDKLTPIYQTVAKILLLKSLIINM
ncbi:hypothetical protein DERF_005734 [Dermatophagoides farinae]|uniref:Uncharacterized protein n=1 Tax=Dermatophagoides farinae TaxID=6954 RepID=A0A922I8U8_DERFA|nr:hypothetical protein DERF_005734 [Dermatophagoides farinae]